MENNVSTNWKGLIDSESEKDYWIELSKFVDDEYSQKTIFPDKSKIFECFNYFNVEKTKVVILGQDPYHNPNQGNGLAFSVFKEVMPPPSLKNIFKELKNDLNVERSNPDLSDWARQGVLLLNTCLTVELNKPNSHVKSGWNIFTDNMLIELQKRTKNIVFVLWGNNAIKKEKLINLDKNLVIKSVHPSPLSAHAGFFGSKPFSIINNYLAKNGKKPIIW